MVTPAVISNSSMSSSSTYEPNYSEIDDILQKKDISKNEQYLILTSNCKPPDRYTFPFSSHVKKDTVTRRFLTREHLITFQWLVYSSKLGGLICKYCWFFGKVRDENTYTKLKALVGKPLNDYSSLLGKVSILKKHDESISHKESIEMALNFIKTFELSKIDSPKDLNLEEVDHNKKSKEFGHESKHSFSSEGEKSIFKSIIMKNVGCDKLSSCLELCGCNTGFDVRSLNESNIHDIEKYVSIACQGMEVEDRKKYLRNEFVNNPKNFILSPIIKTRFFATQKKIADDLDKYKVEEESQEEMRDSETSWREDKANNNTVNESSDKNEENLTNICRTKRINLKNREDKNDFTISYRGNLIENLWECEDIDYEFIIKKSEKEFKDCHLVRNVDFKMYRHKIEIDRGYFCCNLCTDSGTKYKTIVFKFYFNGNIYFEPIKSHLNSHFENMESLKRKVSIEDETQVKRNYEENINLNLSQHEQEIIPKVKKISAVKVESEIPGINNSGDSVLSYKGEELQDLSECEDFLYEELIKESQVHFKEFNLVKNVHFNLYQDKRNRLKGFFCCKLCNENRIIKFRYLRSKKCNFLPIKNHLDIHFQIITIPDLIPLKQEGHEHEESDVMIPVEINMHHT